MRKIHERLHTPSVCIYRHDNYANCHQPGVGPVEGDWSPPFTAFPHSGAKGTHLNGLDRHHFHNIDSYKCCASGSQGTRNKIKLKLVKCEAANSHILAFSGIHNAITFIILITVNCHLEYRTSQKHYCNCEGIA